MPVLRLFAAAREAAGTATVEVPGSTVDDVLDAARARFGDRFASVVDASKVWRNGAPCHGTDAVGADDEVAVLPPVSGGSGSGGGRPTFAPAEPPAPRPRPARRSPGAEAAAERREGRDGTGGPRPAATSGAPAPSARAERRPQGAERQTTPTGRRATPGPRPTTPDGRPTAPRALRPKPVPEPAPVPKREAVAPTPAPGGLTRTSAITGAPLTPAPEAAEDTGSRKPTVLSRMHSVGVPVTGHITIRGKERRVSGARERRTLLGRRYAVVYDTNGPKVSLGVLWFAAGIAACVVDGWLLALLYGIAAGWAGMEAAQRWRETGVGADPWVAGMGAGAVAAAAVGGAGAMGAAILLVVVVAVAKLAIWPVGREHTVSAAGNTVGCAIPFGLAAGCVVLTFDLEIGAAIVLLLFVAAYETGDFLIGSGASNSVEGPVTGIVTIGVVAMAVALLKVPPFDGAATFTFAAFAAVACPLGQLAASAILPAADAHAPAVRRLDSLLLLAPVWVWSVGVFMQSAA